MVCRSIRGKLRSARGASITFALLLFLVCAVVGSVVLVAGTAASGRLSRLNEQDRRYYAVTSAAGLFRDALDGQSCTITCTEVLEQVSTTVYTYPVSGEPTVSDPVTVTEGTPEYSASVASGGQEWLIGSAAGGSLLADAAVQWLLGDAERTVLNAWNAEGWHGGSWTLTLEQDLAEGETGRIAAVRVEAEMDTNANLLLTFTNAEGDPFSVTVSLIADVKRSVSEPGVSPEGKTSVTLTDGSGTTVETAETSILTTEKTTAVTWSVGEVRKVRA